MSSGNAVQKTWNAAHVLFFCGLLALILGYGQFDKQSKIDTQIAIEQRKQDNQRKKEERLKAFMLKDCQNRKAQAQAEIAWRMKYSQKNKDYSVFGHEADEVRKSDIEETNRYIQERQTSANLNCS
ncbi:TPA: hypothetical protein ACGJ23_006024 [Pseudomonas aeruginosa]|uniref:hypothetical protein n=1 Tax=Pseudomonas aeruginosa TaxID=287 RepID=UPI00129859F3|nr:hypothetical protein [Pseudomonas aeruginosa]HED2152322.1 hypothetical protein [Enterobacter hormaechei subsp. hormaechei]